MGIIIYIKEIWLEELPRKAVVERKLTECQGSLEGRTSIDKSSATPVVALAQAALKGVGTIGAPRPREEELPALAACDTCVKFKEGIRTASGAVVHPPKRARTE